MRSSSHLEFAIGLAFALIAVIGSVFFGWDFSGTTQPVPFVLGLIAVILALLLFVRNR